MVQQERPDGDAQALKITLDRLVRNVGSLLNVPSVSVALLDPENGDLVTWAALGAGPEGPRRTRFRPNEGIAGWVAAHLEPVLIHDAKQDARFKPMGNAGIRSMLCVPLIEYDQLLGTLTATSPEVAAFDTRRQQLLQIFADQAVLAISKTRQAEAAKAQARELTALLDASRALTSSLEPSSVFAYIVASIRRVINCDGAVIFAYDEPSQTLRVVTGMGARIESLTDARVSLSDSRSIAAWVAKNRRARVSGPGRSQVGAVTEAFLAGDEMSLLCVPLVSKDHVRGVIMLARQQPFVPTELGAMLNLSNIVAATLENAQIYQSARAEREQQAAIFAAASDAILTVGEDMRISEANEAFARLLGVPRNQIISRHFCELLRQQGAGDCPLCEGECVLEQVLATGEPVAHIECELPNSDRQPSGGSRSGERRPTTCFIDFSLTPITGLQGRRVLLVGRDTTAQREMDLMKATFLSMVSHELRGPLQIINGYLDMMISGVAGELTPEQAGFARHARAGGEHLHALVDDLLLISRRDTGQFSLNLHQIDLTQTLRETAEEMEIFAEDAEITLETLLPEQLPRIAADGPRMAQVFRNLLTNAVKFTKPGGTVTLAAETTADELRVTVRDTGVGIAPEHQERIFDRFFQVLTNVPRDRVTGQGLGLAIVRIIVEGHGGRITVQSQPYEGSTFTVILPLSRSEAGDTSSEP